MKSLAGIDSGSTTTSVVIFNDSEPSFRIGPTGSDPVGKTRELLDGFRAEHFVFTGYHRDLLAEEFGGETITEIRAFGNGSAYLYPGCRTIIDLGGQDTKVINLSPAGKIERFELNDRCSAGTGRFLEVMARVLETDLDRLVNSALGADKPRAINPMCTVFAESEVISLIARGADKASISLGLHESIVSRILGLLNRVQVIDPIVFSGGGAKNHCLHKLLESKLNRNIIVPPRPQFVGALGAFIYGTRKFKHFQVKSEDSFVQNGGR